MAVLFCVYRYLHEVENPFGINYYWINWPTININVNTVSKKFTINKITNRFDIISYSILGISNRK